MKQDNHNLFCTFYDAPRHTYPGHPESPQRLRLMREWLHTPPYPEMVWLDFKPASETEILPVHPQQTLEFIKNASQRGSHEFEPSPSYVTESSYQAALEAAGATLAVSRRILAEGRGHGFAIVRPPGHHAEPDRPMGFCLLNNVAIAAADAIASGLSRVAIIDFDAHHGNGTEAAFWQTPEVGFLSTHEMNLYPGSGRLESASHARGRIINIPLPAFSNTTAFLNLFEQVAGPWLRNFGAELLLVSAGYDAHFSDPLTTLMLDTNGFYQIAQMLTALAKEFCQDRILFVLEGGYDPGALRDNIQACLAALNDRSDFPDQFGSAPSARTTHRRDMHGQVQIRELIKKLRNYHQIKES